MSLDDYCSLLPPTSSFFCFFCSGRADAKDRVVVGATIVQGLSDISCILAAVGMFLFALTRVSESGC